MKTGDLWEGLCENLRLVTWSSRSLSDSWYSGRAGKKVLQINSSLREGEAIAQINLQGVWNIWANIWLQRPLASRKPQTNTVVKRNHLWNSTKEIWKKPLSWRGGLLLSKRPTLRPRPESACKAFTQAHKLRPLHFQVTSVPKASFQMNDGHLFSSTVSFFGSQRWFICQQLGSLAPGNFCQLKPFNETQRTQYQF